MRRLLSCLLVCLLLPAAAAAANAVAPHRVATSVAPLGWLIERIGGDRVEVQVLVPAGAAPETFAPRPGDMERLSRASLYIAVGHPSFLFERVWLDEALARMESLDMNALSGGGEEAADLALDPHIWLSPRRFSRMAEVIAEALAELDPDHASAHRERKDELQREIDTLDRETRARLAAAPHTPRILVLHPAWGWYAADYGIEQVAIEHEGKAPGPRTLIPIIENARQHDIRRVYVQPGFSDKTARLVAKEIGGELVQVDPLARDWLKNMRRVSVLFAGGEAVSASKGGTR